MIDRVIVVWPWHILRYLYKSCREHLSYGFTRPFSRSCVEGMREKRFGGSNTGLTFKH